MKRILTLGIVLLTTNSLLPAGCGCTSSEWSEKAYQPGEKGTIRLVYHPQGRTENSINLVAEIYTNRAAKGVVTLEMAGEIKRQAHSYPAYYNPANGKRSQSQAGIPQDEYEQILDRIREELYAKSTPHYYAPCSRKANGKTSIIPVFSVPTGNRQTT